MRHKPSAKTTRRNCLKDPKRKVLIYMNIQSQIDYVLMALELAGEKELARKLVEVRKDAGKAYNRALADPPKGYLVSPDGMLAIDG